MSETDSEHTDETGDTPELKCFKPLGDYQWPSTSIDRGYKRFVDSLKERFGSDKPSEGVDLARLSELESARLDNIVAPPANEPLKAELDLTLEQWRQSGRSASSQLVANVCAIVLPPCDEENLLRSWALENGFDLLEPPERDAFDQPAEFPPALHSRSGVLVVPRLEEWFLRHDTGLVAVRDLLGRVEVSDRQWVIGCNSWAWQFLVKACSVHAVMPEPLVPAAFDASRLRSWLGRLGCRAEANPVRFRSAHSGEDAFLSDPEQGDDEQNMMTTLAERSLGIPWVAWNQWRASLRTLDRASLADDDEQLEAPGARDDDQETLWVTEFRDFALPDQRDQQALLVLHALLIHGRLTEDEIHRTVPVARQSRVVSALIKSGMVRRDDGWHACVPAAYPAIRDGLTVAGYPMDEL